MTPDAFLADILEHPADDTPRLVYADWLEDQGQADLASRVRVRDVPAAQLRGRTRVTHGWFRYAAGLLAGAVPKTWHVWPIDHPRTRGRGAPDPVPTPGENPASWPYTEGICMFTCSRPYFVVCLRHGFISSVAAPVRRLVKALPAVVGRQPVVEVAVTELFLDLEHFCREDRLPVFPTGRVVRLRANRIPRPVFDRLTPPAWYTYRGDPAKTYPNQTAAREDLSRAFLAWAREVGKHE